jgi:Protein of unknown function (DUF3574)
MKINLNSAFSQPALIGLFLIGMVAPTVYAHPQPEMLTPPIGAKTNLSTRRCQALGPGESFARTELYFGLSKANGSIIGDTDFGTFIDQEVTPRFPDGLTVLSGFGQFKNAKGLIVREPSRILVLFYPVNQPENNQKLEAIRAAYKATFQQESVLRADAIACIAF